MSSLFQRNAPRSRVVLSDQPVRKPRQQNHTRDFWRHRRAEIACLFTVLGLGLCCRPALSDEITSAVMVQPLSTPGSKAVQLTPQAVVDLSTMPRPTLVTASPSTSVSESQLVTDTQIEAPSVIWLIAMPAVPIIGGVFIYLSRRFLGKAHGESRLMTHAAAPDEAPSEDSSPPNGPE